MTNMAIMTAALALLGLGLTVVLILYLGLRREFRRESVTHALRLEEALHELNTKLEERLAARSPLPLQPEPPEQAAPRALTPALNINPHIRAIWLLQHAESPAEIAPVIAPILGLSRSEAELYARVQQLRFRRLSCADAGSPACYS